MAKKVQLQATVPTELDGQRFDQAAARLFPEFSRTRLQAWIGNGELIVNGQSGRARDKVFASDSLHLSAVLEEQSRAEPQAIQLRIKYEDEQLLVIDKDAGVVVHPAAGHAEGTLMNGLLHHCPELKLLPRAGLVHRLDKDTSGLLVVAKTPAAHHALVRQMQRRMVRREYEAIVSGVMTGGGTIDAPLGRHPVQRKKRSVNESGKAAVTHYKVVRRFRAHTHVSVSLETGRTHQIRVHLSHIGFPIVGDRTYGGRLRIPRACTMELANLLHAFPRQALHARFLGLEHPLTQEPLLWESQLPTDMTELLQALTGDQQRVKDSW